MSLFNWRILYLWNALWYYHYAQAEIHCDCVFFQSK